MNPVKFIFCIRVYLLNSFYVDEFDEQMAMACGL